MKKLKSLGSKVATPSSPSVETLEVFDNPGVNKVVFETNEFTSLCPITSAPDWVSLVIYYEPFKLCLESKSLKLYLQSYRNENGFIEQLTERVYNDILSVVKPKFLRIELKCSPRGGISLKATKEGGFKWVEL